MISDQELKNLVKSWEKAEPCYLIPYLCVCCCIEEMLTPNIQGWERKQPCLPKSHFTVQLRPQCVLWSWTSVILQAWMDFCRVRVRNGCRGHVWWWWGLIFCSLFSREANLLWKSCVQEPGCAQPSASGCLPWAAPVLTNHCRKGQRVRMRPSFWDMMVPVKLVCTLSDRSNVFTDWYKYYTDTGEKYSISIPLFRWVS